MPVTRANAAFVRLCHPTTFGLYYQPDHGPLDSPWVTRGYKRWPVAEWEGRFGKGAPYASTPGGPAKRTLTPNQYMDAEGRLWEFFGFVIPLYDADHKT